MPGLLGKRKSRPTEEEPDSTIDAQEILRRHFEARFKPIAPAPCAAPPKKKNTAPNPKSQASDDSQDDDDSEAEAGQDESEWDGVSDEED